MQILVIEPDEFLAENICTYLGTSSYIFAQYVSTVNEGLKLSSQYIFDLVITDIIFPENHNPSWLLELGQKRKGQKIIIISSYSIPDSLSSFSIPNELNKNALIDIVAYYEKPFDIIAMTKNIMRLKEKLFKTQTNKEAD